ncbi:hypothetical protein PIROE2DRAFT_14524, partial [Piromyces sp. E2]
FCSNVLQNCSDCNSSSLCKKESYCFDGTSIKYIGNDDGLPGAIKFGKSGSPAGNIFFDSNHKLITSTGTIESIYICDSSGCNASTTFASSDDTYFNLKASDMNCIFNVKTACTKGDANKSYYDVGSKKVINCTSNKCTLSSTTGYYIDSGTDTHLITCNNGSCTTEDHSSNGPEFFINAGLEKATKPIIYFDGTTLKTISGDTTGVYFDSATVSTSGDSYSNVILCQNSSKCTSTTFDSGIFLSSAHITDSTNNEASLIECSSSGCKELEFTADISGDNDNIYFIDGITSKLIQCTLDSGSGGSGGGGRKRSLTFIKNKHSRATTISAECSIYDKESSGKYYLDYASAHTSTSCDTDSLFENSENEKSFCSNKVISCNSNSKCTSILISSDSQFIDGDSS